MSFYTFFKKILGFFILALYVDVTNNGVIVMSEYDERMMTPISKCLLELNKQLDNYPQRRPTKYTLEYLWKYIKPNPKEPEGGYIIVMFNIIVIRVKWDNERESYECTITRWFHLLDHRRITIEINSIDL